MGGPGDTHLFACRLLRWDETASYKVGDDPVGELNSHLARAVRPQTVSRFYLLCDNESPLMNICALAATAPTGALAERDFHPAEMASRS